MGDVVLGAAEAMEQVVGLVGDEEGVGHDHHEPARERPREVGVAAGVDVEGSGYLAE